MSGLAFRRLRSFILAALLLTTPALAQSGASAGAVTYGGTGCPGGTARAALSRDARSLAFSFTSYDVAAGGTTGRSLARKTCNLAIPISVPAGMSVGVLSVQFRGSNSLPSGASAVFRVESFIAGKTGPVFSRTFTGSGAFNVSQPGPTVWSSCGSDVILRTNSSLRVTTTANKAARSRVDTAVVQSAIVYTLRWRRC